MNILINRSSVRYHVSEAEFAQLIAGETLYETITLPESQEIKFSAQGVERTLPLNLLVRGNQWKLEVSQAALADLKKRPPGNAANEGITHQLMVNPGSDQYSLEIALEVDLKPKQ